MRSASRRASSWPRSCRTSGRLFEDAEGRELIARALEVIQGHPKLLELADHLAADRQRFAAQVDRTREAAQRGGAPLQAFFEWGESGQSEEDFADVLGGWTAALVAELPPTARLLFHFLCRLEDVDRDSIVIQGNWKDFLTRLKDSHPDAAAALREPDEGLPPALNHLAACGLASHETTKTQRLELDEKSKQPKLVEHEQTRYGLHPGVAESGRAGADAEVLDAADTELGNFHGAVCAHGLKTELAGGGRLVVEGARRAAPYLIRACRWEEASTLLERMIARDRSPATLNWAILLLRRIAEETKETEGGVKRAGVLANALLFAGRGEEAEELLRDVIGRCEDRSEYRTASAVAGQLLNLLWEAGRLDEALHWTEKKRKLTRVAGLGPWTQLGDECQRLQILGSMGRYEEALEEARRQFGMAQTLPQQSPGDEAVLPWNVREALLDTARQAAVALERWQTTLELTSLVVDEKRRRGAGELEIAKAVFNDYAPLIRLGRFDEARRQLQFCREVFDRTQDQPSLARTYSALAYLENELGGAEAALRLEIAALGRHYLLLARPEDCAISHSNLANYMANVGGATRQFMAHRLAAGMLLLQTGSGRLAALLENLGTSQLPDVPAPFDEVAGLVEQTEGVRFRELISRVPHRYDPDVALHALWQMVSRWRRERASGDKKVPLAFRTSISVLLQNILEEKSKAEVVEFLDTMPFELVATVEGAYER